MSPRDQVALKPSIVRFHKALREELVLELAKTSLATSAAPIIHIAQELGYSDSTAFNRIIKRHTGTTPLRYRKVHSVD